MSAGTRRNGTRRYGKGGKRAGRHAARYAGRHTATRLKPARGHRGVRGRHGRRAGKPVPAAAVAATLAAGAAGYLLIGASHSDPAQLMAAVPAPAILHEMTQADAGKADSAVSTLLAPRNAATTASGRSHAQSAHMPRPGRPAATQHSAAGQPSGRQSQPSAAAAPSGTAGRTPGARIVSCSDNSYPLPANVTAIVTFLLANGYSNNAAAGIAGNIYQESKGDPESIGTGGGGLIGWTPLPSGLVTGNPDADLRAQLTAILSYDNGWSSYLPELNSAATPSDAAYIYVTDFERAGIPAAGTREASAEAVASACGI